MYDRLLCGGIWCILQLEYEYVEEDKKVNPIRVRKLTPIQMPHIDLDEVKNGRKAFTKEEWITILLRSTGMEADKFTDREKWLLLARMIPLVENNFNLCIVTHFCNNILNKINELFFKFTLWNRISIATGLPASALRRMISKAWLQSRQRSWTLACTLTPLSSAYPRKAAAHLPA